MYKFKIQKVSTYENAGKAKEQDLRFFYTGKMIKADNKKATECCDYLDISFKSSKSSLVDGDIANRFAYITEERFVYMMSKEEFSDFVDCFSYMDVDSKYGFKKRRLLGESKKMLRYLESKL